MDVSRLARASIDETISLVEMLGLVEEARRDANEWIREFAVSVFVHRCGSATSNEWESVEEHLRDAFASDEYLLKVGMLGRLFWSSLYPSKEGERAEIVRWLIRTFPFDYVLGQPYGYDLDNEWYDVVRSDWLATIEEHESNARVLGNAARFFFGRDEELARKLFSKCAELEPTNSFWQERLRKLHEFHA